MKKPVVLASLVLVVMLVGIIVHPQWLGASLPPTPDFLQKLLKPSDSGNAKEVSKEAPSGTKRKSAAREASSALAVSAATAKSGELPVIERTYGLMQSPAIVPIAAQIPGQVTEVHVKDGQDVKAGDLLVTLDDRTLQAALRKDQAALLKDQAMSTSAASDLQRAKALVDKLAGTEQAYEQAVATNASDLANVSADEAAIAADQLQINFTHILAPITGRLGTVNTAVGDLVGTTSAAPMMSITAIAPLKVSFKLPENLLSKMREGLGSKSVAVRVRAGGNPDVLGTGQLDFLDSSVDNASGTIAMSSTIDNSDLKLWPGQHVDVEVEHGAVHPAAIIPTVAVEAGQSGPFVWLIKDDNTVEARPIAVTRNEGGQTAVASGIAPGDRVVVEGQLRLKAGSEVTVASSGASDQEVATGNSGAGQP